MKFTIYLNRRVFVRIHSDNKESDQTVDAQADLSLCWAHVSESTFSHDAAYIFLWKY